MTALSLAPIAHYRTRDEIFDFYDLVARTSVAVVYLGEIVCAKRGEMRMKQWLEIAARLTAAGKQVVIAGKGAIESAAELRMVGQLARSYPYLIEVNDLGAVAKLPAQRAFVAGAHLNLFNRGALTAISELGACRWVAPFEIERTVLATLQAALPPGMETEVAVFGRLPLAHSSRCSAAALHLRTRGNCERCCVGHREGERLSSLDDRPLMVVNGPQTLSYAVMNLVTEIDVLKSLGVSLLRIDPPGASDAERIIDIFARAVAGSLSAGEANARLAAQTSAGFCNGYWFGRPGIEYVLPSALGGRDSPALRSASAASGGM